VRSRILLLAFVVSCEPRRPPEAPPPVSDPAPSATAAPTVIPTAPPQTTAAIPEPPPVAGAPNEAGLASWYGDALAGHKTASGERFDPAGLTAAHRTLPIGTWLEVRRPGTNLRVRVRVNDRGPMSHRFIIDLSRGAAERLQIVRMGVAQVELRVVKGPN
jgi:rare lipoprotein A